MPALVPAPGGAWLAQADGTIESLAIEEARARFRGGDVLVAHALFVAGRLKEAPARPLFDVLELFAFVRPAQPCVPSPAGILRALGLNVPVGAQGAVSALHAAARALLAELAGKQEADRATARLLAAGMGRSGWRWGPDILAGLGTPERTAGPIAGFDVWRGLPQWEDDAPPAKPGSLPVEPQEARERLAMLVGADGEGRPEQGDYTEAATYAFGPREQAGAPRVALIEAGTGIGKTLGYLAPASLWAEKNGPGLWLSTYTRNLQRQIVQEVARLYPDPAEREEKAVVRKGRENYLCLLNFEDAAKRSAAAPGQRSIALGLVARWIAATNDGDMSGAGFPAFLAASFPLREITDRRGECIYSACPHYRTCFIERAVRRARHARIVIANHALVIAQAAQDWLSVDETTDAPERRVRYVFDEGHHLFDAADSGFAAFLSGSEMADLRRWIRGPEGRARTRMRGLEERLKDLVADDDKPRRRRSTKRLPRPRAGRRGLDAASGQCRRRAGPARPFWLRRSSMCAPVATMATASIRLRPTPNRSATRFSNPPRALGLALKRLAEPLQRLARMLRKQLDDKAADLEPYTRARIDAAARGVDRRAKIILPAWISMLEALETGERREEFVDWFEIAREDGRNTDVGLWRHWVDPTVPLTAEVLVPAHGALITSATLRDVESGGDAEGSGGWQSAEVRTGAAHLVRAAAPRQFRLALRLCQPGAHLRRQGCGAPRS